MCEFHESTCGFGDIWWTDNPIYFSSIDYETCRNIGGKHILRSRPNDDMKADSASLFRPAESVHVAFKAAVPTENIETSVTDRSRPYPEFLCCYCIQILLTKPSY